jgi:hypothetical protein
VQDGLDALVKAGAGPKKLQSFQAGQAGTERVNRIRDSGGILHTDPDTICEVLALFYEDLYREDAAQRQDLEPTVHLEPAVTTNEVARAPKKINKLKTGADDGLVAKMLKTGHAG